MATQSQKKISVRIDHENGKIYETDIHWNQKKTFDEIVKTAATKLNLDLDLSKYDLHLGNPIPEELVFITLPKAIQEIMELRAQVNILKAAFQSSQMKMPPDFSLNPTDLTIIVSPKGEIEKIKI